MKKYYSLALAVMIGCNSSSSDSGFTPAPATSLKAVAVVPENFKVLLSAGGVVLNGSKSYDPVVGAPAPTYLWEQTSGTTVTLSSATAISPTFTAPATAGDLTFRLTVTGAQGADTATVTVSVKAFIVTAPDKWFAGYGNPGTITATVTGSTTAPTYLWTGLESWLTVGALNTLVLTYAALPALPDFQNFADRAGVLLMERSTMGRLQLKIKVTDGLVSDEDYVNFSVGPFPDSVANENIALGEPVFLNGAATIPSSGGPIPINTWSWTGLKPNGASVVFLRTNKTALPTPPATPPITLPAPASVAERYVYFVPDLVGSYTIQCRQNDGTAAAITKVIDITCGTYVGVGNLTGKTPDPFVGECASCHAGQFGWLADYANPWKETRHATVFSSLLDPTDPFYVASQAKIKWLDAFNFGSEQSIDSRTVGWSQIASKPNSGWAENAAAEGHAFLGATWEEVIRKHPKTAGRSNVQCESCHGPGSEHAGDSAAIRKSYDAVLCGRCHSTKLDLWEMSGHSLTNSPAFSSGSGNTSCNGCHTAQGFVVEMRAQEGANPFTALFSGGNIARPVLPLDDRRSITCQACHEPHKKTANMPASAAAGGVDPQLRAYGDVKFRNDAVAFAGVAATCYECHQSRTDTRANSADMNGRRAPHDSTAAEMLAATNGNEIAGWVYASSPHADKTRFIVPTKTEARQCLTCHNDVTPTKGQVGYGALGGHSFKMEQGDGTATVNDGVFGPATTTLGTRKFNLTGASGTSSFLRRVVPGDILLLTGGADAGTYTVGSVDGARQLTVTTAGSFTGAAPTNWSVTSLPKYNVGACFQCHITAPDFRTSARGDYDGDLTIEPIQDEITGLLAVLKAAIEAQLTTLVGAPATLTPGSGRIKYTVAAGARTFPGPSVTTSDNPDIAWSSLTPLQKTQWNAVYQAAYNWVFVTNDHSEGIHNTGYAVNLLQSSYQAVTGVTIPFSSPFVPF